MGKRHCHKIDGWRGKGVVHFSHTKSINPFPVLMKSMTKCFQATILMTSLMKCFQAAILTMSLTKCFSGRHSYQWCPWHDEMFHAAMPLWHPWQSVFRPSSLSVMSTMKCFHVAMPLRHPWQSIFRPLCINDILGKVFSGRHPYDVLDEVFSGRHPYQWYPWWSVFRPLPPYDILDDVFSGHHP